jgi:hypothetical protein
MKYNRFYKWVLVSLTLVLMSFSALHKFYLSVSEITYSESDQKLRVVSRIFIDDLDAVLLSRYEIDSKLTTEFEDQMAQYYIEKYLKTKLLLKINGAVLEYNILGHKVDNDQLVFFMEADFKELESLKSIEVQNEVLMDLFEEQQNIVHLQLGGKKKSLMLIRERPSGQLNF